MLRFLFLVIPTILTGNTRTFSQISTKNLGHLEKKTGYILNSSFSTEKCLKTTSYNCFANVHSLYLDLTLNESKKVVDLQSNIEWYYEGGLYRTHTQWHVVCGIFKTRFKYKTL
jgi:hypothetical protein